MKNYKPWPGTYFSCIMIMVASSVVCTIMILNYHHRLATTHTMSVSRLEIILSWIFTKFSFCTDKQRGVEI